jgi:ankyrin repeat protein
MPQTQTQAKQQQQQQPWSLLMRRQLAEALSHQSPSSGGADARTDVNQASNSKTTPLMIAARSGRDEVLSSLLTAKKINVNYKNKFGNSALFLAASRGHSSCIKTLLALRPLSKVNVNVVNAEGNTPLIAAADRGHFECVQELLSDTRLKAMQGLQGQKAFRVAEANKHVLVAQALKVHLQSLPDDDPAEE